MAGVESERDGGAVGVTEAAGRGEDDELLSEKLDRVPAHAGVLGHAEVVAARAVYQEVLGEGERSAWAARVGEDLGRAAAQDVLGGELSGVVLRVDAGVVVIGRSVVYRVSSGEYICGVDSGQIWRELLTKLVCGYRIRQIRFRVPDMEAVT